MSAVPSPKRETPKVAGQLLESGDRMTQEEFHRRYQKCPNHVKAELIRGVVYVASPLRRPHASHHPELIGVCWLYKGATPGLELLDNATTILGPADEPQPDLALRILPEWGGRSRTDDQDYVVGGPELLAEVAHSSRNIDLQKKKAAYRKAGVVEYLVWCLEEEKVHWFNLATGQLLRANRQGIIRSRVFPGLWLDVPALLQRDTLCLAAVVQQGIGSAAHAAFVKRLQAAHRQRSEG